MEHADVLVGRDHPLVGDGIWLDVDTATLDLGIGDRHLTNKFGNCREILAKHLRLLCDKGLIH